MFGGAGADTLVGGDGEDVYVFQATQGGMDQVLHFHRAEDALNITDLLKDYDPLTSDLSDFVKFTSDATGSTMLVNADGHGKDFIKVAHINMDLSGVSLDTLITEGSLVVNQHLT
jgi:serralysin